MTDVVCRCGAYKFPHRQFGGRCSLQNWVDRFYSPQRSDCDSCINFADEGCQVVDGLEQPAHCPELRAYIKYESITLYGGTRRLMDRAQRKK